MRLRSSCVKGSSSVTVRPRRLGLAPPQEPGPEDEAVDDRASVDGERVRYRAHAVADDGQRVAGGAHRADEGDHPEQATPALEDEHDEDEPEAEVAVRLDSKPRERVGAADGKAEAV